MAFDNREDSVGVSFFSHMTPLQLRPLLCGAKICVMPTKCFETFGLSIVESTLAGCIPLVRDIGSLNETAQKYAGLIFTDSKNPYFLACKLQEVLEDYPRKWEDFSKRREVVIQALQTKNYVNDLSSLYFD